jgi:trigger factor
VRATVEELPENRVRLDVEVPEADVKHALEHAAHDLAGSVRVPGFRKGHVPLPVLMARIGREALWDEAVRSHIDGWFWSAASTSGIRPVTSPEVEYGEIPDDGGPFRFSATVAVLAKPEVADWTTLEVASAEADVPPELVERELEELRASVAELVPVDDRPVIEEDLVVLDLVGEETGTQRDYVAEVGDGRLIEPLEAALPGMRAGETKRIELPLEDERTTGVEITVKDVKEKVLPPLDDDVARATSEFETLEELRADIEARLREQLAAELDAEFRERAVDSLVAASTVEVAPAVVERRASELASALVRSVERRGIPFETYLTMTGQTEEAIIERLRAEAEQSVKRELVLDAVAEKLGLDVSDEEVEALIRDQSAAVEDDPDATVAQMREHGVWERLRGDLRLKKALDEVVAGVGRIPADVAAARAKLWTPEKEKAGSGVKLWTPGSEEARTR